MPKAAAAKAPNPHAAPRVPAATVKSPNPKNHGRLPPPKSASGPLFPRCSSPPRPLVSPEQQKECAQIKKWRDMEAETLAEEQRTAYRRNHPSTSSQPAPPVPPPQSSIPSGDAALGDATLPHPQRGSFPGKKRGKGRNKWRGRGEQNFNNNHGEISIESAAWSVRQAKRQIEQVEQKCKRQKSELYKVSDRIESIPTNSPLSGIYPNPPANRIWRKNNKGRSSTFSHSYPDPQARRATDAVQDGARGPRPTASSSHPPPPPDELIVDAEDDDLVEDDQPVKSVVRQISGTKRGRGRGTVMRGRKD